MKNGVTIGIPVYNEEHRVERAIRSAAPQCERLIVADNASTDATGLVCKRLQALFPNMEYVLHPENIGSIRNWSYLLEQVTSPMYLTLGSHDWIAPDYVEKTRALLDSTPDSILAVGEVCSASGDGGEPIQGGGWNGVSGDTPRARVVEFIYSRAPRAWASYGLFRTRELKDAFSQGALPEFGPDMVLLARIAQRGKILVHHGVRYYAWIRRADSRQDYYQRIMAKKIDKKKQRLLRAEGRLALYDIFMQQYRDAGLVKRAALRFSIMVRLGPFKTQARDPFYYAAFVPVKVGRFFVRSVK